MNLNPKRWDEIDKRLFEIIADVDTDILLSPINRQEEMAKLIASYQEGRPYNPVFEYERNPDFKDQELLTFMARLDRNDPVEELYYHRAAIRLGEIEMAQTHDAEVVKRNSLIAYGRPSAKLLAQAWHNLKTIPPERPSPQERLIPAEEAAALCRQAMKDYGFSWKVTVVKEFGAQAAVDNFTQEFIIRADVQWSAATVTTTIVHEIGTHVLRSANGYEQPLKLFGTGLPLYMLTEEGLAEYTEVQHDCFDPETHRRISGRAVSADLALTASFWEVFMTMIPYFDPERAFDIAQRVKFGIADTASPGAFTKDYFYLEGLARLTAFFGSSSLEDKKLLYLGKISLDNLPLVKTLVAENYLHPPKYLPPFVSQL